MHPILRHLVAACCLSAAALAAASTGEATPSAALRLVLGSQADEIARVDAAHFVHEHDTKLHAWTVQRPVAPGVLDTTHTYVVSYRIDGETVARWVVDTRERRVTPRPCQPGEAPEAGCPRN